MIGPSTTSRSLLKGALLVRGRPAIPLASASGCFRGRCANNARGAEEAEDLFKYNLPRRWASTASDATAVKGAAVASSSSTFSPGTIGGGQRSAASTSAHSAEGREANNDDGDGLKEAEGDQVGEDFDELVRRRWQKRYPLLSAAQLKLMVMLERASRERKDGRQRTPAELADLHFELTDESKEMEASVGSFAYVLKYAHTRSDDKTLRQMGQAAIWWQKQHTRRSRRKSSEPMKGQEDENDLRALVRNLRLSLAVRTRWFQPRGTELERNSGKRVPTAQPRLLKNDEHFVHARILRARVDPLRRLPPSSPVESDQPAGIEESGELAEENEDEDDEAQRRSRMTKGDTLVAQSSRPRTHHSRRLQRSFRNAEKELHEAAEKNAEQEALDAAEKSMTKYERRLLRRQERQLQLQQLRQQQGLPINAGSKEGGVPRETTSKLVYDAFKLHGSLTASENAYDDLKRWDAEVTRRRSIKRRVLFDLDMLRKYRGTTLSDAKRRELESTAATAKGEAKADVVPTWLLLSALKVCAERGQAAEAERIVENYLLSLYEVQRLAAFSPSEARKSTTMRSEKLDEAQDWVSLLPRYNKTHAVSEPTRPPNGPVLLNAILRAALSSTQLNAFESMLGIVERWCVGSEGLSAEMEGAATAKTEQMTATTDVEKTEGSVGRPGKCLLPDETTVLLLLEALRGRRWRADSGHDVVDSFVKRWGASNENVEGTVRISTRAARLLVSYALRATKDSELKQSSVRRILKSHLQWMRTYTEEEEQKESSSVAIAKRKALMHWRGEEVYRWKNLMNRLARLKILNKGEAVELSYGRMPNRWKESAPAASAAATLQV